MPLAAAALQRSLNLFEIASTFSCRNDFHATFYSLFDQDVSWKLNLNKDVHIIVPFAYLSSSYSKFEWAENAAVQARLKKLSGKQICCTTKWFL